MKREKRNGGVDEDDDETAAGGDEVVEVEVEVCGPLVSCPCLPAVNNYTFVTLQFNSCSASNFT